MSFDESVFRDVAENGHCHGEEPDGTFLEQMANLPVDLCPPGNFRGKFKKMRCKKRPTILAGVAAEMGRRVVKTATGLCHGLADTSGVGLDQKQAPRSIDPLDLRFGPYVSRVSTKPSPHRRTDGRADSDFRAKSM
ncbi:hypothetical protein SKAU_G00085320 [Synaphobranchus kaupii]|uniref:Uncharacterized protein n=1 Tax=Synaphobranchus kaupii TaxID=118154 RepID=A0A9Q1FW54_SYNKA|nr:hypothetical protein SKAU_G00085320 [Synaphobranchus kaupii]